MDAIARANATPDICDHTGRIEGHSLTPPRQYCKNFNASECAHHWVPKGNCEWQAKSRQCNTDPRCVHAAAAPKGTSYIFFKFHKVGSSTVASTLRLALIGTSGDPFTGCMHRGDIARKSAAEQQRYRYCNLCANHDNSLPLLIADKYGHAGGFRQPAVLRAPAAARLRLLFEPPFGAQLDSICPQRASLGNVLRTGTVFRNPLGRVVSKYFFLRTYCGDDARRAGLRGCAADELDIVSWLYASPAEMERRRLLYKNPWQVSHEVLAYTGGAPPAFEPTEAALRQAQQTLDAMDVVGITERMDETVVLFSEAWALPLGAMRSAYTSLLQNPTKRPLNESALALIRAHPGVAREAQLYEHALHRFERAVRAVPQLEAKLAFLRADGAVTCGLNRADCARQPTER